MKILVIGGGGREHAIIWKLAQSPKATDIYCAPGNAGIAEWATCVDIGATDVPKLAEWAEENAIDLTVVGMDDPLMLGVVDAFEVVYIEVEYCLPAGRIEFCGVYFTVHSTPV